MLFLYQDWAVGMLVVKVWARAMTVEAPFGLAAERPVAPAAPDGWRARLERLMRTPLRQLPFLWTLRDVVWPLVKVRTLNDWPVKISIRTLLLHAPSTRASFN